MCWVVDSLQLLQCGGCSGCCSWLLNAGGIMAVNCGIMAVNVVLVTSGVDIA